MLLGDLWLLTFENGPTPGWPAVTQFFSFDLSTGIFLMDQSQCLNSTGSLVSNPEYSVILQNSPLAEKKATLFLSSLKFYYK